jgi:DNA repair protein RecO (recombination protein O)
MKTNALQAYVLHKRPLGETSVQVTFLTRQQGLVAALYKGGRSPKKQALLQGATPLWLTLNAVGERHYVRQLEVLGSSLLLVGESLFASLYINELLMHVLRPFDACPLLFDDYSNTLRALMTTHQRTAIEPILRRFEWSVLVASGQQFSLTHDTQSNPILPDNQYTFVAGDGFVATHKGLSGALILAIAEDKLDDASTRIAAKGILRRAIHHLLDGKSLKSRRLYSPNRLDPTSSGVGGIG